MTENDNPDNTTERPRQETPLQKAERLYREEQEALKTERAHHIRTKEDAQTLREELQRSRLRVQELEAHNRANGDLLRKTQRALRDLEESNTQDPSTKGWLTSWIGY